MQVTIDIEPRTYSLLERIKDKGLSLDDVLHEALNKMETEEHPQRKMSSEEWIASLKDWSDRSPGEAGLSEDDLRRDSIYSDRT